MMLRVFMELPDSRLEWRPIDAALPWWQRILARGSNIMCPMHVPLPPQFKPKIDQIGQLVGISCNQSGYAQIRPLLLALGFQLTLERDGVITAL